MRWSWYWACLVGNCFTMEVVTRPLTLGRAFLNFDQTLQNWGNGIELWCRFSLLPRRSCLIHLQFECVDSTGVISQRFYKTYICIFVKSDRDFEHEQWTNSQDLEHLGNKSSLILILQQKIAHISPSSKIFNQRKAKEIKEAVKITFLSGAVDGIPRSELLNLSSLPVFCTTTAVPVFSIWYFALSVRVKYFAR